MTNLADQYDERFDPSYWGPSATRALENATRSYRSPGQLAPSPEHDSAPTEAENGQSLSQQIRLNPREFLKILRDDFAHLDPYNERHLTPHGLAECSRHCKEPVDRTAAKIARQHFDEIGSMGALDKDQSFEHSKFKFLTYTDVITAENAIDNDLSTYIADLRHQDKESLRNGLALLALGGVTCFIPAVRSAHLNTMLLRAGARRTGAGLYGMLHNDYESDVKRRAQISRERISSWSEFK
jgi:hypothetical protein